MRIGGALLGVLVFGGLVFQPGPAQAQEHTFLQSSAGPSIDDYVNQAGPGVKVVPHGTLKIDGRLVNCGKRPTVRGSAMNPRDHPHGGGEGKSPIGGQPQTPWGKPAMGLRTRKRKASDKLIVSRPRDRRR